MRRDLRNWALSPVNLAHNEEALTCSSSFQPCKLQALCHKMKYKKMLTFLAHFYAFIFRVGILQTTLDYLKLTFAFFFLCSKFRLSYCPLRLSTFSNLLKDIFGEDARHQVFGDFEPLGQVELPAYYVHMVWKATNENVNGLDEE